MPKHDHAATKLFVTKCLTEINTLHVGC